MIRTARHDGVARVSLDRPDLRNAIDDRLIRALREALEALEADPAVRAVVLTGEGTAFSAGANLNWMRRMRAAGYEENLRDAEEAGALFHLVHALPKPVVARVNGPAVGGGVGLVAACDVAIASREARFSVAEVRLGIVPALIAPYVVARIGAARARTLFLTGETVGADEALRLGLVDRVAAPAALDAAVAEVTAQLLQGGAAAQAAAKELVARAAAGPTPEVRRYTAELIARIRVGPEAREGIDAFLEKRPPAWRR
jgi:methylglutaconyl-CoA hydratase